MSWIADLLTSGGIGSAIGAVAGIGQKIIATKMENDFKTKEFAHIEKMHLLQNDQEIRMAEFAADAEELKAHTTALTGSYTHDASFENTSKWVDNIRALVRPVCTVMAFGLTAWQPDIFAGYLGLMLSWWFAGRLKLEGRLQ